MAMLHPIFAVAQYAAKAAPVLPLDVAMHFVWPLATMSEITANAKRSLYDPDALPVSSLKNRLFRPDAGPMLSDRTTAVSPSPTVIRAASGIGSIMFAQRQILIGTSRSVRMEITVVVDVDS